MPNYMFDMNLFASVCIDADNVTQARRRLARALSQTVFTHNLANASDLGVTEVVISQDDGTPELFEVDGEPVNEDDLEECEDGLGLTDTTPDEPAREFAFDVTLAAVIRVRANRIADALALIDSAGESLDLSSVELSHGNVRLTEASVRTDKATPVLFEIDGVPTELRAASPVR